MNEFETMYAGVRNEEGCRVLRIITIHGLGENKDQIETKYAKLPLYLDEVNHSPTGFEWGYCGSGPSQLAFAILYDFTGDVDFSRSCYKQFKIDYISKFNQDEWSLDSDELYTIVEILKRG